METKTKNLILLKENAAVTTFSAVHPGRLKMERLSLTGLVRDCLREFSAPDPDVALSMIYLMIANPVHLETIKRMTNPRLRNLKTRPQATPKALEEAYRIVRKNIDPERKEMKDTETFDRLVETILGPVKETLRLPAGNPAMFAYPISPEVLAAANNPTVRRRLEGLATSGPVLSGSLDEVIEELFEIDPDDADRVRPVLLSGETRDHLGAMALEGTGQEMAIGIVNPKGRYLRLSGRRFELLIEKANTTRSLGSFSEPPQKGDFSSTYLKTTIRSGEILGQYEAQNATLRIACIDSRKGEVGDSCDFILDNDAVVCTYLAAKRLRQDLQRFITLRDEAESRVAFDPFKR